MFCPLPSPQKGKQYIFQKKINGKSINGKGGSHFKLTLKKLNNK